MGAEETITTGQKNKKDFFKTNVDQLSKVKLS